VNLVSSKENVLTGGLFNSGSTMTFSANGKTIIVSNQNNAPMMLVDIANAKVTPTSALVLAISPDGKTFVESDVGKGIVLKKLSKPFDASKIQKSYPIGGEFQTTSAMPTCSANSKLLAVRSAKLMNPAGTASSSIAPHATLLVYDAITRRKITEVKDAGAWFAFSPDSSILAVEVEVARTSDATPHDPRAKSNLRIKLVNSSDGTEIGLLDEPPAGGGPAFFSPNNETLAAVRAADQKFVIKVWNSATCACIATLDESPIRINDPLVFSPDSASIAALCGEIANHVTVINRWNTKSGKVVNTFTTGGRNSGGSPPSFSIDGNTLAAGCGDNTIKLWTITEAKGE